MSGARVAKASVVNGVYSMPAPIAWTVLPAMIQLSALSGWTSANIARPTAISVQPTRSSGRLPTRPMICPTARMTSVITTARGTIVAPANAAENPKGPSPSSGRKTIVTNRIALSMKL